MVSLNLLNGSPVIELAARLLSTDVSADAFEAVAADFLSEFGRMLQHKGLEAFRILPRGLRDGLVALNSIEAYRRMADTILRREAVGCVAGGTEEDRSVLLAGIAEPGLCGAILDQLTSEHAEGAARWLGECVRAEFVFMATPPDTAQNADAAAVARAVRDRLTSLLLEISSPSERLDCACLAARLVLRRAALRYILLIGTPDQVLDAPPSREPIFLAHLATMPLVALGPVEPIAVDPDLLKILRHVFAARDYLYDNDEQLGIEILRRTDLARYLRTQIGLRDDLLPQDLFELSALCAPRSYSHVGDYKALQAARADLLDELVRLVDPEVDASLQAPAVGSIGLMVAALPQSAETDVIITHYRAFAAAGFDVTIVLWPHAPVTGDIGERIPDDVHVLDLRAIQFDDRVRIVRDQQFQALLYMNNLTWGWSEYIRAALYRLASTQIVTFLSVITVGFRNLDYYLVGSDSEGDVAEGRYIERLCRMAGSVLCFPAVAWSDRRRPAMATNAPVAACGATLPKMSPGSLREILAGCRDLDVAAIKFYPFNPAWGETAPRALVARHFAVTARSVGFPAERVELVGPWLNRAEVNKILLECDIYFDSFPHSGGLSVLDAIRAGLPIVFRTGNHQRSLQSANVIQATGAAAITLDSVSRLDRTVVAAARDSAAFKCKSEHEETALHFAEFGTKLRDALELLGVRPASRGSRWAPLQNDALIVLEAGGWASIIDPSVRIGEGLPAQANLSSVADESLEAGDSQGITLLAHYRNRRQIAGDFFAQFDMFDLQAGEQIRLETDSSASEWSVPLASFGDFAQRVILPIRHGASTGEIRVLSSKVDSSARCGPAHLIAHAPPSRLDVAARWTGLSGFSFWEQALPSYGLPNTFRWCVGGQSRLKIDVDGTDWRGIRITVRTAMPQQVLSFLVDGMSVSAVERPAGWNGSERVIDLGVNCHAGGSVQLDIVASDTPMVDGRALACIVKRVAFIRPV